MSDLKWMDLQEFRDAGFLQEVNRLFFHPHGLALALEMEGDQVVGLAGVWDCRDDPEGARYLADQMSISKVLQVQEQARVHLVARRKLFGAAVQPV